MSTPAEIRAALDAVSNAPDQAARTAALSRLTTISAHTALTIPDDGRRHQFVTSLSADIEEAKGA